MAAITPTIAAKTEFAGSKKLVVITGTLTSASDTVTLTTTNVPGVQSISGIVGFTFTGGIDAALLAAQVSFSGLVVTIVTKDAAGSAATDWTGATFSLALLVDIDA